MKWILFIALSSMTLSTMAWSDSNSSSNYSRRNRGRQEGPYTDREEQSRGEHDRYRDRDRNHEHGRKSVTFNIFCSYRDEKKNRQCYTATRFEKNVTENGYELQEDSEHPNNAAFVVECNGKTVFNGYSRRFMDNDGTHLQAESVAYPITNLPIEALTEGRQKVNSTLEFTDSTLEGKCLIYTGRP